MHLLQAFQKNFCTERWHAGSFPPLRDSLRPRAHRLPLEQHNRSDTNIRLELQTAIVCCRHMSADDTSFSPQHTQTSLFSPFPSACLFPYASISFVYLCGCVWVSLLSLSSSLSHSFRQSVKSLVMCCLSCVRVPLREISSQPSLSARQPHDPQGGWERTRNVFFGKGGGWQFLWASDLSMTRWRGTQEVLLLFHNWWRVFFMSAKMAELKDKQVWWMLLL